MQQRAWKNRSEKPLGETALTLVELEIPGAPVSIAQQLGLMEALAGQLLLLLTHVLQLLQQLLQLRHAAVQRPWQQQASRSLWVTSPK